MAFDGFALSALHVADQRGALIAIEDASARAGGDRVPSYIAMHDRIALTLGYGAFGLCIGAVAALVVGGLQAEIVAALVAAGAIAVAVTGRSCLRVLHWSALPLVVLIVGAAAWAVASTTLPDRHADLVPALGVFALALPLTSAACCRAFPAAFAVSMLGMALAAPVGAATMVSIFG